MLSNEALERVLGRLQSRFDEVNSFYIRKIAEQIKKIGRLSQANINRLVIMADMTSDVREITERLVTVTPSECAGHSGGVQCGYAADIQ